MFLAFLAVSAEFQRVFQFFRCSIYRKTTAVLKKLAGMALRRRNMLRTQHRFKQGDKVRNSDVFLLLFLTSKKEWLKSQYKPYNISVAQQRFSLVSFEYPWLACKQALPGRSGGGAKGRNECENGQGTCKQSVFIRPVVVLIIFISILFYLQ